MGDAMTHTPTPWKFSPWHIEEGPPAVLAPAGHIVCTTAGDDDAAFIVKACNMHDELLRALIGATHALYSYQHGNASTELAKDQAEFCASIIAKAREATP
jgi:hypothetical protein